MIEGILILAMALGIGATAVPQDASATATEAADAEWPAHVSAQSTPQLTLPTDPVTMFLRYPGPRSRFQMIFSDIPEGMAVQNDMGYDGWCVDRQLDIPKNTTTRVRLYSSVDPLLPGHLARLSWNEINYLVNHKAGTPKEVQAAIWHLVDGRTRGLTPAARKMVEAARRNGAAYIPGPGEILAVICEPFEDVQTTFIEYTQPVVLGAEGEAPAEPTAPEEPPSSQAAVVPTVRQVVPPTFTIVDPGDPGGRERVVIIEERGGGTDGGEPEPPAPVPLPSGVVLLAPGLAVVALARRKRP
ncbi:hypothetical protein SAMN02746041_02745 [Desulfacinum hydrothermale DSM 13146]|uniref:Uncharacterized protein n=2 Tax=Desulfacinum hydrothermale TaxID=109258 RepID=A0A1W1XS06_9BACT|nr:hypothetical protein SAMN02746041_02745 [Desulfacinum hydrothermale DSM 13146]